MFESILVKKNNPFGTELDVGLLAESLLFYKQVIIPADRGLLSELLRTIGPDNLLGLIKDGHIFLTILDDNFALATSTDASGVFDYHKFVAFEFAGDQNNKKMSREEKLTSIVERATGSPKSKKIARQLAEKSQHLKLNSLLGKDNLITDITQSDMGNPTYVTDAVKAILEYYAPNYAKSIELNFKVIETDKGLIVDNNIDFNLLNQEFHKTVPKETASLTSGYILSHLITARGDLALSSHHLSEVLATPLSHILVNLQFKNIVMKRERNAEQISTFQNLFLDGSDVREAINSGAKSFTDFRKLLDQATKFKNWTGGLNPDAKLITEYHKASIAGTWAESLTTKILRFGVCGTIGLFGDASGTTASVADSFILDKILKGWRPHHFVQGELMKFVQT